MSTVSAPEILSHFQTSIRNLSQTPLMVYWETTQACALACKHCRASAMLRCHPKQLSHEEGSALLKQIASFGAPMPNLVLTGGDPLERPDLFELIAEATALKIPTSITPSATPSLTRETIHDLKAAGIRTMALSLDGSTMERHDAIRQVEGCFERTLRAAKDADDFGIPLQINTLVCEQTVDDLPAIYELIKRFHPMRWSLFFLIGVGRGAQLKEVTPERGTDIIRWAFATARVSPFAIKTTEAPYYRRVALTMAQQEHIPLDEMKHTAIYHGFGIRDGHGIVFISHTGEVYPSGFLPLPAGSVKDTPLPEIYRNSPVFQQLHNPDLLKGRCGACEFRKICGGSRARAYGHTGDMLASDPFCQYVPKGWTPESNN
jgi:AdoMet-dependent heme synthase